ncbi:MAG TPA: molybdopterin cofactor-binding domain-containing protein, partial [Thermoanaerobaculia bacterium]
MSGPERADPAAGDTAPPLHRFDVDRRDLLKLLGGGMLFCLARAPEAGAQESGRAVGGEKPKELSAWLHIDKDGKITAFTGKVEVGQNIRTSLAQQVAEELGVAVASVAMVMGDTDRTPFDMGTFGSRTTREMAPFLRAVAASAREGLIDAAAKLWSVDRAGLSIKNGRVVSPSGKSASFGELTRGEELVATVDERSALTPATTWRIAGQTVPKIQGRDFVTGAHRYSSDLTRPGMLHGKILRPPSFRARIAGADGTKAAAMPGVEVVIDGDFIGVAAPDPGTARRAVDAITVKWTEKPDQPSDATIFEYLKSNARPPEAGAAAADPAVAQALATAPIRLKQTYTVAYIAHAPLEPRAAVAEWERGKLTVWTGTQRPFAVRDQLAETFRIPRESVRVIVPDTGSAYGGKHQGDAAVEAARLAKSADKPVKVVWSREEEFTWAYFRPAGVIEVATGATGDGAITAWDFHNYNSGPAAIETPYEVAHKTVRYHPVESPLRQGSYRALAATA